MTKKQELLQRLLKRDLIEGEIIRLRYMNEQQLEHELKLINYLRKKSKKMEL